MADEVTWQLRYGDKNQHEQVVESSSRETVESLYKQKCESWDHVSLIKLTRTVVMEKISK